MEGLRELVGRKVAIYTADATQDVGTLERAEGHWVVLRKNERELLYFSVHRIRLIKPFES